jgi:hypothetical protein
MRFFDLRHLTRLTMAKVISASISTRGSAHAEGKPAGLTVAIPEGLPFSFQRGRNERAQAGPKLAAYPV